LRAEALTICGNPLKPSQKECSLGRFLNFTSALRWEHCVTPLFFLVNPLLYSGHELNGFLFEV
jgi:hypothetical protein